MVESLAPSMWGGWGCDKVVYLSSNPEHEPPAQEEVLSLGGWGAGCVPGREKPGGQRSGAGGERDSFAIGKVGAAPDSILQPHESPN